VSPDYDIEEGLATEQVARAEVPPPCEFVCGIAGSGKTFGMVKAVQDDPSYGVLSATTGIASVNLGAITVNSLLKYSDTRCLRDHFLTRVLSRVLHSLAKQYRRLIVDEVSMADAEQLDIWYRGVEDANRYVDVPMPMGITLVGDFAQLAPIKAKWAFEASCWQRFAENTTRLTKVWRQGDARFLEALNLVRRGEGAAAAEVLTSLGARFETALDTEFDGTTILPRNDQVGRYNALALDRVPGQKFKVTSRRWGQQRSEWGQSLRTKEWGIPPEVELKIGAYVMLLANAPDFEYVNGDCGEVVDHLVARTPADTPGHTDYITIKLVRTGKTVCIAPLVRGVEHSERPTGWPATADRIPASSDAGGWHPRPHYRTRVRRWVTGQIEYWPLRLAYATTVHKSQSLTLDRVQCDFRNHFFQQPAMLYVALSRARTLQGLRLVGMKETFAKHCNFDERIREWL
jgi:hypothetical protein